MAYSRVIQIVLIVVCGGLGSQVAFSHELEVRVLSADRSLPAGLALRIPGTPELLALTFHQGRRSAPHSLPKGADAVEVVRVLSRGETEPAEVETLQRVSLKGHADRVLLLFVSTGESWQILVLSDDVRTQPVGALVVLNGTSEPLFASVGQTRIEVPAGRLGAPVDISKFSETKRMVLTEVMDMETGKLTTEEFEVVENGVGVILWKRTGLHGGHLFESPITASTTERALLIVQSPLKKDGKRYRILLVPEHFPAKQASTNSP
jgi:hypothetical protein